MQLYLYRPAATFPKNNWSFPGVPSWKSGKEGRAVENVYGPRPFFPTFYDNDFDNRLFIISI